MAAHWAWWGLVPPMVRGAGAAVRPAVRAVTSRVAPSCAAAAGAAAFSRSAPVLRFPCLAGLGVRLPIAAGRLWASAVGGEHRRALSAPAVELGRGPPPATVFAVAEIGGKQYKVTVDDSIVTENMVGRSVGETVVFDKVMLVGDKDNTTVGQPYIKGASVTAVIEQLTLAPKVYIFKMRRRKNSKRLRGFRASVTSLRIRAITAP